MTNCISCGNSFSIERKKLGYRNCLDCGDKVATKQTQEKKSRVTCAYNKSGLMYVSDIKTTLNYERKNK